MYLFAIVKKSLKFTILFNEYKILLNPNRNISRSQMAGINRTKIRQALIFVRVSLEILPTNGKINILIIIIIIIIIIKTQKVITVT